MQPQGLKGISTSHANFLFVTNYKFLSVIREHNSPFSAVGRCDDKFYLSLDVLLSDLGLFRNVAVEVELSGGANQIMVLIVVHFIISVILALF